LTSPQAAGRYNVRPTPISPPLPEAVNDLSVLNIL